MRLNHQDLNNFFSWGNTCHNTPGPLRAPTLVVSFCIRTLRVSTQYCIGKIIEDKRQEKKKK